jgi:serine/threonine protein kinase
MNPLDEEKYLNYLASQDDAMAAGGPYSAILDEASGLPAELNDRLRDDVAWCEFVRSELARPGDGRPEEGEEREWLAGRDGPARIGRFEVRRELGRGSFGVVFLAYDPRLRRQVALKVPRPEVLVTDDMRRRFEREARAAAGLDHPNVVPVFEAGEEGPVGFIASAYCPGPTLSAWLKARPGLVAPRLAARIALEITQAIAHAHGRGVLHRDLKPGNIIMEPLKSDAPKRSDVDGLDSIPRVTDFGLARVVATGEEATAATQAGAILGTPSYMAPEQAEGGGASVGPAADVYGLGGILYALLVGRPPFQADSVIDTLLLLRTQEPVAPSRLRPRLPRDIETICLTCLEKEPARRYRAASALADDLERYLTGKPIHARPTPGWERALKWARRRPALAALAGVSIAAILVLVAVVLVSNARLQRQVEHTEARRQEAQRHFEEAQAQRQAAVAKLRKAREAVDRMLTRVGEERLKDIPQVEAVQLALLEDALEFYRDFARQAHGDREVLFEASRAYRRVGGTYTWLGRRDEGERCYTEALALQQELANAFPKTAAYRNAVARSHLDLAALWLSLGRHADMETALQNAFAQLDELAAADPTDPDYAVERATAHNLRGRLLGELGRFRSAETEYLKAIGLSDELAARFPAVVNHRTQAAAVRNNLAVLIENDGRLNEAEAMYRRNLELWEGLAAGDPSIADYRSKMALAAENLAIVSVKLGRKAEAEQRYRQAADLRSGLTRDFPSTPHHFSRLGDALAHLAELAADHGDLALARQLREQVIASKRKALVLAPRDGNILHSLQEHYTFLIELLIRMGAHEDVARTVGELVALSPGSGPGSLHAGSFLARCAPLAEADTHLDRSRRADLAKAYADRAVALLREAVENGFGNVEALRADRSLDALRSRADFQALVAGSAANRASPRPSGTP